MLLCRVVLLGLLMVRSSDQSNVKYSDEDKLQIRLLMDYDPSRRPVKNSSQVVEPHVIMILNYFTVYDDYDEISMSCSMMITWIDEFLKWDPSKNNGVNSFFIHGSKIWQPTIDLLKDDITQVSKTEGQGNRCSVHAFGQIFCLVNVEYASMCASDPRRWPHDEQNCTLVLDTAEFSDGKVQLKLLDFGAPYRRIYTEMMIENRQWAVISNSAWETNSTEKAYGVNYPSLHFSLLLRRRSATHEAIVIIPAISLALLNIACGLLAPGSIRISFSLGLVFAHIEYLLNLDYIIPSHGDNPPYIITFFGDSLMLTSLNIAVSVATLVLVKLTRSPPKLVVALNNYVKTGHDKFSTLWTFNTKISDPLLAEEGERRTAEELKSAVAIANLQQWKNFSVNVDRVYFISTTCIYVLFFCIYVLY